MGAEWSSQDFSACSPHPAGTRISFAYTPSNLTSSEPSLKSATPAERVRSAPATGRHNVVSSKSSSPAVSSWIGRTSPQAIPSASGALRPEPDSTSSASGCLPSNGDAPFESGSYNSGSIRRYNRPVASPSSSEFSDTDNEAGGRYFNGMQDASPAVSPSPLRRVETPEATRTCDCACHGRDVVEAMRNELRNTKLELARSRDAMAALRQNEAKLRQRLSEQARRQLEKSSTKFEDLSLGDKRPTQLIRRYGNLYTESRLEALDALDDIAEMSDFTDLKGKLLLTILVLAFRNARKNLLSIKVAVRRLLHIPELLGSQMRASFGTDTLSSTTSSATSTLSAASLPQDPVVKELDDVISVFLRKTVDRFDLTRNYEEVCDRVWDTLYDFPKLRHCPGLLRYIEDCVRLAWALTVQNPPFNINFEFASFSPDLHTRFHTSDPSSDTVRAVLWPVLTEGDNGPCVYKGVVIT